MHVDLNLFLSCLYPCNSLYNPNPIETNTKKSSESALLSHQPMRDVLPSILKILDIQDLRSLEATSKAWMTKINKLRLWAEIGNRLEPGRNLSTKEDVKRYIFNLRAAFKWIPNIPNQTDLPLIKNVKCYLNSENIEDIKILSKIEKSIEQFNAWNTLRKYSTDKSQITTEKSTIEELDETINNINFWYIQNQTNLAIRTSVVMDSCKLMRLSPEIKLFKSLTSLDLSYNKLTSLPLEIKDLPLKNLNIASNKFTLFPEVITYLTELEKLDLNRNKLTQLPSTIKDLTKLEELNLHFNNLNELPTEIRQLPNLKIINLKWNPIKLKDKIWIQYVQLMHPNQLDIQI